jgi:lipoyl(octanoyl) transferase
MNQIVIRHLGIQEYLPTYEAMKQFTANRDAQTPDEIWVLEHPPVYTLGQAGDSGHLLHHGPGQVVVYLLLDLRRRHLFVRQLVSRIEQAVIDTLADSNILSERHPGAPGIYLCQQELVSSDLWGAKIAALGLKVTKQCCYHGLALNVNMDLSPFDAINPCGYAGLRTIDMASLGVSDNSDIVVKNLLSHLSQQLEVRS